MVAMMVAGIVVSGLLYLVVELLQIDRRESILTQVQTDMQRAVDYISDDMREAVYIYDNPATVAAHIDDSPGGTPILAFWRINPIDKGLPNCASFGSTTALFSQCKTLEIRQATYSLVIYFKNQKTLILLGKENLELFAMS
ncbi:MAG: hypothetical protein HC800_04925 [Phormidesmis sp. RL_2_1]|nr:hypothetical protein [Phormidesmis sp. RL_2_1]